MSLNQALSVLFSGLSRVATAAIYFYNLSYMHKPRIAGLLLPPSATRVQQMTAPTISSSQVYHASQYLRQNGTNGEWGQ